MIPNEDLHPGCVSCKLRNVASETRYEPTTKKLIARKGDFAISCNGIPKDSIAYASKLSDLHQILDPKASPASEEDIQDMASIIDPVLWAEKNIVVIDPETQEKGPWMPQGATDENIERYGLDPESSFYQELMVKCTAKRALYRIGRRSGKTWTMAVKILHKMFTNQKYRVLIITPNISQQDLIFECLTSFIEGSPTLSNSIKERRKTPQRFLSLANGSQAIGFVGTNESMRGQAADLIVIDETAYIDSDDLSAVTAIFTEHRNVIVMVASTPSGARDQFYNWDMDPEFRSFHFPSFCRPKWTEKMELEQRKENPGMKFIHEIQAEHGEIAKGVFQHEYINRAISPDTYRYEDSEPEPGITYCMGVDWNPVHGTEIVVIGADLSKEPTTFKVVDCGQVFREGNTQTKSVVEIIKLNRKWNPSAIYVDRGAGSVQIEMLETFGVNAEPGTPDFRLREIVKAIDFGSKIEMFHPGTGERFKKYAKPAVIDNAVRLFESNQVMLTIADNELITQLRAYIVERIGANGRPTYKMNSDTIADHRLDAFVLCLFAFTMEYSKLGAPQIISDIGRGPLFGEEGKQISLNVIVSNTEDRVSTRASLGKPVVKNKKVVEHDHEEGSIPADEYVQSDMPSFYNRLRSLFNEDNRQSGIMQNKSRAPIRRSTIR